MTSAAIVTRFAPSPTGYLHVGGARTALFAWLLARHSGGRFLLRIEDTDQARSTQQAVTQLLEDLRWLGLNWDNEQLVYQSQRTAIYDAIIDDLIGKGLAYKAYETPVELEQLRREAEIQKRAFIYRRPKWTEGQIRKWEAEKRPHVVRFAMPHREFRFTDAVLEKEIVVAAEQVQDFVIRKTDGMPTYHFAVVVDDAQMGVNHILRGQEHLLNTINHIALQEALGYPRPVYGHLPIILNPDGSKMGKRDRDKKIRLCAQMQLKNTRQTAEQLAASAGLETEALQKWLSSTSQQLDLPEQLAVMRSIGLREADLPEILVHDFRKNGYLPETLLNFLALLGWSPGEDRQAMSMEQMVSLFSLGGIGKANARFDRAKLLAFNTDASAQVADGRLLAAMRDFLSVNPDSPLNSADDGRLLAAMRLKPGFHTLRELDSVLRFLFVADESIELEAKAVEKVLLKNQRQGLGALVDLLELLEKAETWTAAALETAVNQYCQQKQIGLGQAAQPIRVALCGGTISPPIFETLQFMGRQATLGRMRRCVGLVGDAS